MRSVKITTQETTESKGETISIWPEVTPKKNSNTVKKGLNVADEKKEIKVTIVDHINEILNIADSLQKRNPKFYSFINNIKNAANAMAQSSNTRDDVYSLYYILHFAIKRFDVIMTSSPNQEMDNLFKRLNYLNVCIYLAKNKEILAREIELEKANAATVRSSSLATLHPYVEKLYLETEKLTQDFHQFAATLKNESNAEIVSKMDQIVTDTFDSMFSFAGNDQQRFIDGTRAKELILSAMNSLTELSKIENRTHAKLETTEVMEKVQSLKRRLV